MIFLKYELSRSYIVKNFFESTFMEKNHVIKEKKGNKNYFTFNVFGKKKRSVLV